MWGMAYKGFTTSNSNASTGEANPECADTKNCMKSRKSALILSHTTFFSSSLMDSTAVLSKSKISLDGSFKA
jgi:hypothetical protein